MAVLEEACTWTNQTVTPNHSTIRHVLHEPEGRAGGHGHPPKRTVSSFRWFWSGHRFQMCCGGFNLIHLHHLRLTPRCALKFGDWRRLHTRLGLLTILESLPMLGCSARCGNPEAGASRNRHGETATCSILQGMYRRSRSPANMRGNIASVSTISQNPARRSFVASVITS